MLAVTKAEYAGDYRITVSFNNGKVGTVNLEQSILRDNRPVFSTLRNKNVFQQFTVEHSTVIWSDALDLSAEYLFYLAFQDDLHLQEQFRKWGYI